MRSSRRSDGQRVLCGLNGTSTSASTARTLRSSLVGGESTARNSNSRTNSTGVANPGYGQTLTSQISHTRVSHQLTNGLAEADLHVEAKERKTS